MNDFPQYIDHLIRSYEAAGGRLPWHKKSMAVLLRDEFACRYCGEVTLTPTVDHQVPMCAGGTDDMSNLVCACHPCNASKGSKSIAQWRPEYSQNGNCGL